MPIYDIFTKRHKAGDQSKVDVYRYDALPNELRTQILYILVGTLGRYQQVGRYDYGPTPKANGRWEFVRDVIARERGVFSLTDRGGNPFEQCANAILYGEVGLALDVIDLSFRLIDKSMRQLSSYDRQDEGLQQDADDAIEELNHRFSEHGVGYRFEGETLVRLDSGLLHAEVTQPALRLLHEEGFEGPLDEFMAAHRHFRKGETKDANVDALNALESTLKTICDKKKWRYGKTATASDLVRVVVNKGLIPPELLGHFEHLLKAMETGLPPVRHNYGGHGQGAEPKMVAEHLAAYSLHSMAADIVLLIEAYRASR